MSQPNIIARQRLYLTADKSELVAAGDSAAASLYCSPGDEIPASAHERFGLVDGALPGFQPEPAAAPEAKDKPAAATKPKAAAQTKDD